MRRSFKLHVGLSGVYNGDDEFMAGESIMFSGPADKIPAGYLIEDGSEVGRVAYATLFAAIGTTHGAGNGVTTFNLPDSRGEFWRGLDLGRGIDVGREIGVGQLDAFQGHTHTLRTAQSGTTGESDRVNRNASGSTNNTNNAVGAEKELAPFGVPRVADETRPRNIAKIPLIKY